MANLNKSSIASAAGVSYKTVQRKWPDMKASALAEGVSVSIDYAVEWFRTRVSSRSKKSPRAVNASESSTKPAPSAAKPAVSEGLVIHIGGDYPIALSIDEAQKLTVIEKNKAAVRKYQRRLIRLFLENAETEINSAMAEIQNFLRNECNLTPTQSGKLNALVAKLASSLRESSVD